MTTLLTGASGTIGRLVVDALAPAGDLRTFGRRAPSADLVEHIEGDVVDLDAVRQAAEGVDTIVHLAGLLEGEDSLQTLEVNLRGTYHVLEAAREQGVRRVVFASSIAATGCLSSSFVPEQLPIRESDPCRPDGPYAASKLAAEALCDAYANRYGISTIALRIAGVQRPSEWADPPWETQRSPILWTWISARDASRAFVAAKAAAIEGFVVINIAADDTCSLRPTRDLISDLMPGSTSRHPSDRDDGRWPLFDLARSRQLLDWTAIDRFDALFRSDRAD